MEHKGEKNCLLSAHVFWEKCNLGNQPSLLLLLGKTAKGEQTFRYQF